MSWALLGRGGDSLAWDGDSLTCLRAGILAGVTYPLFLSVLLGATSHGK